MVTGDDAQALQACSHRVRRPVPGRERSIGRKDLTRKILAGNGRDGPAMRPKHPPAAESGVGEHTARESEGAQRVCPGRSARRTPTRYSWPRSRIGSGAMLFFKITHTVHEYTP